MPDLAYDPIAQSQRFNSAHRIGPEEAILWGYRDGGRRVQFDANGRPLNVTTREIIVVRSPQEDPVLRKVIADAKVAMASMQTTAQKAKYLHDYVDSLMKENDPAANERIMDRVAGGNHVGHEISIGQLIEARTGVCRHRSLLFKVLADQTGVPADIVRGNYRDAYGGGGHAWNEVTLENGQKAIVDVMHQFIGDMSDPKVKNYTDVHDNYLYRGTPHEQPAKEHGPQKSGKGLVPEWSDYRSGAFGDSLRHDRPFSTNGIPVPTTEMLQFQQELHGKGVSIEWGFKGENAYAYVRKRDGASIKNLERIALSPTALEEMLAAKSLAGEIHSIATNKGPGLIIAGANGSLRDLQVQLEGRGIRTVLESGDGDWGAGLRIRSESLQPFQEIAKHAAVVAPAKSVALEALLAEKARAGKIGELHTNKGPGLFIRGSADELSELALQCEWRGIETVIERHGSSYEQVLRIKSASVPHVQHMLRTHAVGSVDPSQRFTQLSSLGSASQLDAHRPQIAVATESWQPMLQAQQRTNAGIATDEAATIREAQMKAQQEALTAARVNQAPLGEVPGLAMQPKPVLPMMQPMAQQQQQARQVERRTEGSVGDKMRMKPRPVEPSMPDASNDVPDDGALRDRFGRELKTDPRTGKPMDPILESRANYYAQLAENDVILGRNLAEPEPVKTAPAADTESPAKKRGGLHQLVASGSDASWRELEGHFERMDAKHPVPANDQQMGLVGDAPKPETAVVEPDAPAKGGKGLWAARDTKLGKGIGVATVATNAAAALKAASEGNMDEAKQYAGVAVINAASEAAFSYTGAKLTVRAAEKVGTHVGLRGSVAAVKAVSGKIPVAGAIVGAVVGIGETGYEIYEAFNGRSNWRRVTGTFASGVAGTVGGLLGFGAGEALQEGVHFGTKGMWGDKDAARHSGTVELVSLGSQLLGGGHGDDWRSKQAKAAIAKQKEKAAASGSVHSNFAGRAGAQHLISELQELTGQIVKGGWGRFVGNGDKNVTAQELRQEMSEHKITIAELDRNKDGNISGRELSDAFKAHGVDRHPVTPKKASVDAPPRDWRAEQAAAVKKTQAQAAVASGSAHSSFAGRAGAAHLNKELSQIDAQMDRTNWGKFIGNGDANVTVAEMRQTMMKYDIKISEIDKNKDGNISGREFTNALTAHGVNRHPVGAKK